MAACNSWCDFTFEIPTEDPRFAGFTKIGQWEMLVGSGTAGAGPQNNRRRAVRCAAQSCFMHFLVHGDDGREHARRRHTARSASSSRSLHRAIFAKGSVQDGENDIDVRDCRRAPAQSRAAASGHRSMMRIRCDIVLRRVHRRDDRFSRVERYLMLAGSPAAKNCYTQFAHNILCPIADMTSSTPNKRRSVHFIDHRIHFHDFHGRHEATIADRFHGQMRFAIGHAAADGRADAGRFTGSTESMSKER